MRAHKRVVYGDYDEETDTQKKTVRPYKKKAKYPRKPRYYSKSWRAYQQYLLHKYGTSAGALAFEMAESLYATANRDGFMRRFMMKQESAEVQAAAAEKRAAEKAVYAARQAERKIKVDAWSTARNAEIKVYNPHAKYNIPETFIQWEDEFGAAYGPDPELRYRGQLMKSSNPSWLAFAQE